MIRIAIALLNLVQLLIVVRAIVSWFPGRGNQGNSLYSFLTRLTEPVLGPIRNVLFRIGAMRNIPIDLSPIIAFFIITLVIRLLYQVSYVFLV